MDQTVRPLLATAEQATAWLGLPAATIERLAFEGELPAVWVGNEPRFTYAALEQWAFEASTTMVRTLAPKERSPRRARTGLSPRVRFLVLRRDDYCCRYCGRRPPNVELAVDHIIPVVDGGPDDLDNLTTACVDCNTGKGRLPATEPLATP